MSGLETGLFVFSPKTFYHQDLLPLAITGWDTRYHAHLYYWRVSMSEPLFSGIYYLFGMYFDKLLEVFSCSVNKITIVETFSSFAVKAIILWGIWCSLKFLEIFFIYMTFLSEFWQFALNFTIFGPKLLWTSTMAFTCCNLHWLPC